MKSFIRHLLPTLALSASILVSSPALAEQSNGSKTMSDDFALKLFTKVAKGCDSNAVISPFSAYQALSMATNGADGNTRAQMAKAIGVSSLGLDALNKRNHDVLELLNVNEHVQMEIANGIFSDKGSPLKPSFVELCRTKYFARAESQDLHSPKTLDIINKWCSDKTHGKITKIVDSFDVGDNVILLNSVYFKGHWADPFENFATSKVPFTLLSGAVKKVPLMRATRGLAYLMGDNFQAVSVPYAGRKQSMYLFLPAKGTDFKTFLTQFTAANWDDWLSSFSPMEVKLEMPKYRVEFEEELKGPLQALGVTDAFCPSADFRSMFAAGNTYINKVLQKTYLDVNEEGTEAAAVTALGAKGLAFASPPPPISFRVDHPFVVAIVDSQTREILFLGSIVDPAPAAESD